MGIYSDGNVYGVCWNIYNESGDFITRFEKIYLTKMTIENIQEIKQSYDILTDNEKNSIIIRFYTNCTDTYGSGTYMSWFPGNKDSLEELFLNGDIPI